MEEEKNKVNVVFFKIPDSKTELEKVASTVATFLNDYRTARLFRRVISYGYHKVISKCMRLSATKTESKKVASTVATFFDSVFRSSIHAQSPKLGDVKN